MPAERYFTEEPLVEKREVVLSDNEHHHLAHVMRVSPGDHVELVDGKGTLATAEVVKIGKRGTDLKVLKAELYPPKAEARILIQAIPRQGRLDTILEKGTELGATAFWLFPGQRGERKLKQEQLLRLRSVTIAALKQCGRLYLPAIQLIKGITNWTELPENTLFGDLSEKAERILYQERAAIVIGPESGLTEDEVTHLQNLGGRGVTLHTNILRTDTAAICALSQMAAGPIQSHC